ncbi:MAG: peptide chain release factor aRF-1 [Candidatus Thorarchaeota archaeon]
MGKYKLRRIVKELQEKRGRHTELISVYVPSGYSLNKIAEMLHQEQSLTQNVKDKTVRKNVLYALEKIIQHLKIYKQTPPNGLVIFCGNVSEKEGQPDVQLWALEPPEPIRVKLYWCDQRFELQPLLDMMAEEEVYGLVNIDRSESTIAVLSGKSILIKKHKTSLVPGKVRAGGQSAARYGRVREGMLKTFVRQTSEDATKIFGEEKKLKGVIISGPGPVKEQLLEELPKAMKAKVLGVVDTSYTGEVGLQEAVERGKDLLKDAAVTKEKQLLQKFFEELQKGSGLVTYGVKETMRLLQLSAVETLLLSEDTDLVALEVECSCGFAEKLVAKKDAELKCEKCGKPLNIIGEMDIIDFLEDLCKDYGSEFFLVSKETQEGKQFLQMSGIGAILRYKT